MEQVESGVQYRLSCWLAINHASSIHFWPTCRPVDQSPLYKYKYPCTRPISDFIMCMLQLNDSDVSLYTDRQKPRRKTSSQQRNTHTCMLFRYFHFIFLYFILYLNRSGLIFILPMQFFWYSNSMWTSMMGFWWASRITTEPERGWYFGWLGFDFHLSERFFLSGQIRWFCAKVNCVCRCIYMYTYKYIHITALAQTKLIHWRTD